MELVGILQKYIKDLPSSPLASNTLDCTDHFQSAIYNSFVGYYREGFSILRNVLESMLVGAFLELENDVLKHKKWLNVSGKVIETRQDNVLVRFRARAIKSNPCM